MYALKQNILKTVVFISCLWLVVSCNKNNETEIGKDYTIKSQAEAAKFNISSDIRTLTISGEDITDISMLQFKTVKSLKIANTGIVELEMPYLSSITGSLLISENKLLSAIEFDNLKFINAIVTIDNNPVLKNIAAFLKLKTFQGSLIVTNNDSLGEDKPFTGDYAYGLFPIRYLSENSILQGTVTLMNNHPKAATEVALIGNLGKGSIIDYTISSAADAQAFAPSNDTLNDLTLKGIDITDDVLKTLATKFKVIKGTVTLEKTSVTTTEGFFDVIKCLGGIVFKDNLSNGGVLNAQGFKAYTNIGGDLIIDNTPGLAHWGQNTCFAQVVTVTGDVRLIKSQMASNAFTSLTTVGGDFEIRDCNANAWWNMSEGVLKTIGGDFIYVGNDHINGLSGLQSITHIGGNVTIGRLGTDNNSIGVVPDQSLPGRPGWCLIKSWIQDGIVSPTATITLTSVTGDPVDLTNIIACH
jgi:hypothetical protein